MIHSFEELSKWCELHGVKVSITRFGDVKAVMPDGVVLRRKGGYGELLVDLELYLGIREFPSN